MIKPSEMYMHCFLMWHRGPRVSTDKKGNPSFILFTMIPTVFVFADVSPAFSELGY